MEIIRWVVIVVVIAVIGLIIKNSENLSNNNMYVILGFCLLVLGSLLAIGGL
jgi:hypothetical protein